MSEQEIARKIAGAYRELYGHDNFIPLHEPCFEGNESKYVLDCVETGWVSSVGSYVTKFGESLAEFCGAKHCVPTNSGTSALHLAGLALGWKSGDLVICQDLTFAATAAAICYTGAQPVFLDVDKDTMSLSPSALADFLERNPAASSVKGVVVMHNIGFPARMRELMAICKQYDIALLEDAAESLGSTIDDRMCGTLGDVGIFSFNGNKVMTTGGGGAVVTNSQQIAERVHHLANTAKLAHPYKYIHDEIGYNYRMPNLNAALGVAQLEQMPKFLRRKQEQATFLKSAFEGLGVRVCEPPYGVNNNWFVVVDLEKFDQERVIQSLAELGVMARTVWSQISCMEPYAEFPKADNPNSKAIASNYICLPNGVAHSG